MTGFEVKAIVTHQAGELQQAGVGGMEQRQRKPRFPGAGRAADQRGARTRQHRRGVHRRSVRRHHIAGSRTMKRAPSTAGASSAAAPAA